MERSDIKELLNEVKVLNKTKLNQKLMQLYNAQLKCFWTSDEVDLSADLADIQKMPEEWSNFIKFILAFFAVSDQLVNVNLSERMSYFAETYCKKYKQELNYNWGHSYAVELIHQFSYSEMLHAVISDNKELEFYIDAVNNFSTIKEKAEWILNVTEVKYKKNPALILIASACIERISFAASFAGIFWFRSQNLLPGIRNANSFIFIDENYHATVLTTLFNILMYEDKTVTAPVEEIQEIVRDCCDIEKRFTEQALPKSLPNMNCRLMHDYIEYIGDHLLTAVGVPKIYNTENPFDFMENISLEAKSSFFESKPTSYQKASALNVSFDVNDDL